MGTPYMTDVEIVDEILIVILRDRYLEMIGGKPYLK